MMFPDNFDFRDVDLPHFGRSLCREAVDFAIELFGDLSNERITEIAEEYFESISSFLASEAADAIDSMFEALINPLSVSVDLDFWNSLIDFVQEPVMEDAGFARFFEDSTDERQRTQKGVTLIFFVCVVKTNEDQVIEAGHSYTAGVDQLDTALYALSQFLFAIKTMDTAIDLMEIARKRRLITADAGKSRHKASAYWKRLLENYLDVNNGFSGEPATKIAFDFYSQLTEIQRKSISTALANPPDRLAIWIRAYRRK